MCHRFPKHLPIKNILYTYKNNMITQIVISMLSMTVTNNILFGNDNEIIINGDNVISTSPSTSPLSPSPLSPSPPAPLVDPYCPVVDEESSVTMDEFPPTGSPEWVDPIDKPGLTGYSPDVFGLEGAVLNAREAYPSGAHLCTQSKLFADGMGASGYGYPNPSSLVASGGKFMDEFIPFKVATAALPMSDEKTIRQTMIDATEGLMLIFRGKEMQSLDLVGTRYWANLLFYTSSTDVDTAQGAKHLYPLIPTFVKNVKALAKMRVDVTGNTISAYFSEEGARSILVQYGAIIVSAYNHGLGALASLRQTGYTPEAAAAWRDIFDLDWLDKDVTDDDVMQIVPSLTYDLATHPSSGMVQPKNFYICTTALKMWEYMSTIEAFGTKFSCTAPGAQILQAFSELFTYELEVEGGGACDKPARWSIDLMATVVYEVGVSQKIVNGAYGTPFLTAEQTRVLSYYIDDIICLHLGRINKLPGCVASGTVYHSHQNTFKGDMMWLLFPSEAGPDAINGTLGQPGVVTVEEVCDVYLQEKKDTCGALADNSCPHTPVDKLSQLTGRDKCTNYDELFASAFPGISILNSCAAYATYVTNFDPQYDNGCGFELIAGSLASFVNYDTRVRDLCPEQCNYVPAGC
jgi:hypothetical protein